MYNTNDYMTDMSMVCWFKPPQVNKGVTSCMQSFLNLACDMFLMQVIGWFVYTYEGKLTSVLASSKSL